MVVRQLITAVLLTGCLGGCAIGVPLSYALSAAGGAATVADKVLGVDISWHQLQDIKAQEAASKGKP